MTYHFPFSRSTIVVLFQDVLHHFSCVIQMPQPARKNSIKPKYKVPDAASTSRLNHTSPSHSCSSPDRPSDEPKSGASCSSELKIVVPDYHLPPSALTRSMKGKIRRINFAKTGKHKVSKLFFYFYIYLLLFECVHIK
jgi:hypothetical protein